MRQALRIFTRDVKRLFHNWAALLVIGGVCFLPSLYAWFNISANMDPYGNTGEIKVAVANMDTEAENGEISLNAGKSIVAALKENHQLGWCFVDEEEAVEGVRSGEYYAAIVIPNNFSESLISVLNGSLQQPQLDYYVNDKINAVTPKITETGATTIQQKINDTFESTASEAVSKLLKTSAIDISDYVVGANDEALTAISKTRSDIENSESILTHFQNIAKKSSGKIPQALAALNKVKSAAESSSEALAKAETDLKAVRSSLGTFSSHFFRNMSDNETNLNDLYSLATSHLNNLNNSASQASSKLKNGIESVQNAIDKNNELIESLQSLSQNVPEDTELLDRIDNLKKQNDGLSDVLADLKDGNKSVNDAANSSRNTADNLNNALNQNRQNLQSYRNDFDQELMPEINQALDSLATLSGTLSGILNDIPSEIDEIELIIEKLENSLTSSSGALDKTKTVLENIDNQLASVETDIYTLQSSAIYQRIKSLENIDVDAVSDFMYSPVSIKSDVLYSVKNYGSAMTPFYTNLALWVGGLILVSIFKQEVYQEKLGEKFTPTQTYFGRWMLFEILGLVQGFIVCLGDVVLLKVQCVHPVAFIFAGMFCSFVYVNFIYALAITFKHIGKAIAVILVILQIPGSSGTYPIQMMPEFFRKIYPLLPFTYGIDAMREAIAGMYGNYYEKNLLILAIYIPIAFLIGLAMRPLLMNLNHLFDTRLSETEIMVAETDSVTRNRPQLRMIINALLNDEVAKKDFVKHSARYEEKYPKLVRYGLLAMMIIPSIFLILMFSLESKLVFLIMWIIFVVGLAIYLICVEYIHERIKQQLELSGLTSEDLILKMKEDQQ